jgi:hypothetical protein
LVLATELDLIGTGIVPCGVDLAPDPSVRLSRPDLPLPRDHSKTTSLPSGLAPTTGLSVLANLAAQEGGAIIVSCPPFPAAHFLTVNVYPIGRCRLPSPRLASGAVETIGYEPNVWLAYCWLGTTECVETIEFLASDPWKTRVEAGDSGESSLSADDATNDVLAGLINPDPVATSLDPDSAAASFFLNSLPKNCLVLPEVGAAVRSSCSSLAMSPAGASRLARLLVDEGPAALGVELNPQTLSSCSGDPVSLLV